MLLILIPHSYDNYNEYANLRIAFDSSGRHYDQVCCFSQGKSVVVRVRNVVLMSGID